MVKSSNPGKEVAPFRSSWCSSYQKGSLQVTLDYGHQLYFTLLSTEVVIYEAFLLRIETLSLINRVTVRIATKFPFLSAQHRATSRHKMQMLIHQKAFQTFTFIKMWGDFLAENYKSNIYI